MSVFPGNTSSLRAYPNITAAAMMLGVSASTISRRDDLVKEMRGERDAALAPGEVLRLARIYRKRSVNDVAQELVEHADAASAEDRQAVEREIEAAFAQQTVAGEREELLRLARRLLPSEVVEQVQASLSRDMDELPDEIEGYVPAPSNE